MQGDCSYWYQLAHKYPVLSKEETLSHITRYQNGDLKAGNILVKHNLALVIFIAKKYKRDRLDISDMIQEGCTGLEEAARKYKLDLAETINFCSYSSFWIKSRIRRYINFMFERRMSHEVNESTLLAEDQNELEFEDENPNPYEQLSNKEAARKLRATIVACLDNLPERERQIVYERYMMQESKTLDCISARLGICRERVRQLEIKGMKQLKQHLKNEPVMLELVA